MANQEKDSSRAGKQAQRTTRREQQRLDEQRAAQRRRLLMILGAVAGVAIIAVLVLILVNRDDEGGDLPGITAIAAPDPAIPVNGLTIGDPNAPVAFVEYGDYQCPYCADFSTQGLPPMMEQYIATGQVSFTFVPFSFLGDESIAAAEAAYCANDQGQFWAMHETIYANHHGENEGAFSTDRLATMAEKIGLDMDQYRSCVDSGQRTGEVENSSNVAKQAGITSTPTFVINNGEPFGWTSWEAVKAEIDAALGQ